MSERRDESSWALVHVGFSLQHPTPLIDLEPPGQGTRIAATANPLPTKLMILGAELGGSKKSSKENLNNQ